MSVLDALTSSFNTTRHQLLERVSGLTDDEYLWEPVNGMWSVRTSADGWRADWVDPDPEPPPPTTIAWRMWHIAVDALDSYSGRAFGSSGTGLSSTVWVGTAMEATALVQAAFSGFIAGFHALGDDGLGGKLGEAWTHYSEATYLDLFLHAHREVTHHGAEIALLRDLYRAGGPTGLTSRVDPA